MQTGSSGQDTVQAGTIWGKTMKNQPGTMNNHENQPGIMKNHENRPGTMKNHENRPGTLISQKRHTHISLLTQGSQLTF